MFPIAKFLDRAKVNGKIKSDYQLSKVIGITQSAISQYRMGGTLPDERVITKLCTLSGDDAGVILAQIQAERVKSEEGKLLWRSIAQRLQATAAVVTMTTAGAMAFVAEDAQAMHSPALLASVAPAQVCILCSMILLLWLQRRRIFDSLTLTRVTH